MRPFTIWHFKSVDGLQSTIVVRPTVPVPSEYTNEYNRILARLDADTPDQALRLFNVDHPQPVSATGTGIRGGCFGGPSPDPDDC